MRDISFFCVVPLMETNGIVPKTRISETCSSEIIGDSCPFQELRDPQIKAAFDLAMSDDFEVCVVATMSAGKSTLINAMLGSKLMPSKQENSPVITYSTNALEDLPNSSRCFFPWSGFRELLQEAEPE